MKRFFFLSVLLALFGIAAAQSTANSHLQSGLALFKQGQFESALEEFKQAHIAQPKDASLDNLIGITDTKIGNLDEANRYYAQAIQLNPQLPGPHKNLGFNCLTAKIYDVAERELKIASDLSPRDPFVHYYLATLYLATSRDKQAVEQLEPARALLNNDPDLSFQLVLACLRVDSTREALSIIGDMEQRSALDIGEEYKLAIQLSEEKMYPEAVDRFRRIVQMQSGSWSSKYDLCIALIHANQPADAVTILQQLSLTRGNDPNLLTLLGLAYEAMGNSPQALESYEAAVKADPENPDRYLDYTRLLMDLDRYGDAAQIVQQGMKNTPDAYALNLRLGSIQMNQGQYDEARQSFQKAIQTHPEITLGHIALAQSYMRQGRDREALQVLTDSRKTLTPDAMLEYMYGLVLSHISQREEAIAAFKRSIALSPEVAEPHYELGKLYFESGLTQPARTEFERVLELAPQHANAYYQLSRIYQRLGDSAKSKEMAQETQQILQRQREEALRAQAARIKGLQGLQEP